MNEVFRKLQLTDQDSLLVLGAPTEFRGHLDDLGKGVRVVVSASARGRFGFVLVFVRNCAELTRQVPGAVRRVEEDGVLWFAYPKKSSRRYSSDIGRDDSWRAMGALGFEGVRMVAIDEDWSALRFRHVDRIKTLRRDPSRALSARGRERTRAREKA